MEKSNFKLFDAHFHVIDPRFPLVPNQGYLPGRYLCRDYLERTEDYQLVGGVVVSASFQAFDQDYLVNALGRLGAGFVGVTQLPATVSNEEILELDLMGIRGIRFNLKRGGSAGVKHLDTLARRVFDVAGWHSELYVDSSELTELYPVLSKLPAVSIDHLGLTKEGFDVLLKLAEKGVKVKATGFGRVNFDVAQALRELHAANPACLMFGTDLPSMRAARPYSDSDFKLVIDTLGEISARTVFHDNAAEFYRSGVEYAGQQHQRAGNH